MSAHRDPATSFALGQHWTFRPRRPAPYLPVLLQVEQDRITALPHLQTDTIGLELLHDGPLDKYVAQDLAEHLITLPGVELPEATRRSTLRVDVPVAAPGVVLDTEVVWPVTTELSVHHANYDEVYLVSTAACVAGRTQVELTRTDCSRLIVALASLLSWQSELTEVFSLIAAAHRRSLRRGLAGRIVTC